MDARMALLQAVAVGPVGGGRLPSSRPVSASTTAPEQAVAMVAPAPYQRRSQATSGDRSWSSDASLPTLSSGTTTTSGARQSSKRPSGVTVRSEEHTSELQSLMRISYAVFCLKKKKQNTHYHKPNH